MRILRNILPLALAGSLLAGAPPASFAQTDQAERPVEATAPFAAIPEPQRALYRFDLGKNFFTNPAAFQAAQKSLEQQVKQLEAYKGKVTASPKNLYTVLKLSDDVGVLFGRVYVYQYLQYATNTKNTEPRDKAADLDARITPRLAFVPVEMQKLTPQQIQKYLKAYPALKTYEFALQEVLRGKPHTLSLKEEELIGRLSPTMTQWQEDQYDMLLDRTPWGKVKDPETGEELDVRQDAARLNNSPIREVRKEQYEKENTAYSSQRDLYAFTLTNRARTLNTLAQVSRFKNSMDSRFFAIHLTYADVDNAFNQILAHGTLRKRLQTMQRDRIRAFTGYETVNLYDMSMVPPGVEKPRFTIGEATDKILDATKYLGAEYQKEMAHLLDPRNGRLDIVPGPNRVPGAFTYPMARGKSPFFSYGYQGYLHDMSTLAHEGGHAVHRALQNNARIPPANMQGPSYFTESYSIMNELVLMDRLYREATDPELKVYYLEQLLQQLMGFYGTTRIAAVEKAIYEGVQKGSIKTADDLDKLTFEIGKKTSIWHELDPQTNNLWQQVEHFYKSGTRYENYVFADLLAQTYFAMYRKDPAGFAKRYTAMMRNGHNAPPAAILKKFMGIDLKDPKTFDAMFAQQERYLNDLQRLYEQVPVRKAA